MALASHCGKAGVKAGGVRLDLFFEKASAVDAARRPALRQWIVSWRSSIATNSTILRALVSAFLTLPIRYRIA